jgi:hypothetical protein
MTTPVPYPESGGWPWWCHFLVAAAMTLAVIAVLITFGGTP